MLAQRLGLGFRVDMGNSGMLVYQGHAGFWA